jgi:hypothetical protein
MTWPGGLGSQMRMYGRARDLKTGPDGTAVILAEDSMRAAMSPTRTIDDIEVQPARPTIAGLVGATAGRGLRSAIDSAIPDDRRRHTPLALLLDDIAGASVISGFAWSRYGGVNRDWPQRGDSAGPRRPMMGVCSGFRPGSSALRSDGSISEDARSAAVPVAPLVDPDDPVGWHDLDSLTGVAMRRARRMDVWHEDATYQIDAHFRDCCTDERLGLIGVHEYSIEATIDADRLVVTTLAAIPRVLPFAECPAAAGNMDRLLGQPLPGLRGRVVELLNGIDCCTHLNDALRALADVSALLPALDPEPDRSEPGG